MTILSKQILGAYVYWTITLNHWNGILGLSFFQWAGGITFAVIQGLIFLLAITVPDVIMVIVARIYFTECYLYTKSFVNEVTEMGMDEIIEGDVLERYLEMHKKIAGYKKLLHLWILNVLLQLLMSSWHAVSIYLHPNHYPDLQAAEFWFSYQSLEALVYVISAVFILWPAMLMTENKFVKGDY